MGEMHMKQKFYLRVLCGLPVIWCYMVVCFSRGSTISCTDIWFQERIFVIVIWEFSSFYYFKLFVWWNLNVNETTYKFHELLLYGLLFLFIKFLTVLIPIGIYLQARIKKIMQADEDVGKIAMAVPLLVCKYFLEVLFTYFSILNQLV